MFSKIIKIKDREIHIVSIIFLIPSLIFMILFIFYPIVDSFILSLHSWNGIDPVKTFVGIENWKILITDIRFWKALKNNLLILFLSIIIQMPVAILLALAMDYVGRKFNFLRSIYFLPMLMSSVAIGFLFRYAYDPQFGIIAGILNILNIDITIDILGNPNISIFAIIVVICWQFIPFYFILYVASISSIPLELYEAAKIDGSNYFYYAKEVVIPYISPTIKSSIILSMVGSLKYFDLIYVMTEGGPNGATDLMATYMYKNSFVSLKLGYGATIAFAMLIIISIISFITFKKLNTAEK
ncbi:ABC transporter permease [Brachyspira hampsonii]|uniref:ABC transporter permease n=1 Tax=Brachyspira hampsonii TaxID=1287055 RepID=A0AAC9XJG1_9SPIR|nr:sugar ABC transporter permease [Brachyspira hampsonii]ASJ20520.1 ABC transporter permease [Brachyspira hampsonii]MBW5379526.1 sugar ABC transporter permease [Brachyspira hampsonii]MBW5409502.1 sugar ABC transporter permease [Brachyspira hampsonii]OEJ18300.1 ABC transporter permease [Brachyspira hampsonii]